MTCPDLSGSTHHHIFFYCHFYFTFILFYFISLRFSAIYFLCACPVAKRIGGSLRLNFYYSDENYVNLFYD